MEELAGRPEAGAALEVAALLRRAWAGARASEAEVRGAHVPIGGSAANACGWRACVHVGSAAMCTIEPPSVAASMWPSVGQAVPVSGLARCPAAQRERRPRPERRVQGGANERTNEYWVTQDTDGKGRLTQDTHLPVTKRRPNPRPSRY